MNVIEIFLPLQQNDGSPQPPACFREVRNVLIKEFSGLTAYTRAPAEGLWEREAGAVDRDSLIILEVVADSIERAWWKAFRERLERLFQQQSILIRAVPIERL